MDEVEKTNMRIRVDREFAARWENTLDRLGQPQQTALFRLVQWFMDQDEEIQLLIVTKFSTAKKKEIAKMLLEKLANTVETEPIGQIGPAPVQEATGKQIPTVGSNKLKDAAKRTKKAPSKGE